MPWVAAGTSGVLLGLSNPGMGWWPLAWVGFIPIWWAITQTTQAVSALLYGVLFGGVYATIVFGWFTGLPPLAWMGIPDAWAGLLTMWGWSLFSVCQALAIGLICLLGYGLKRLHHQLGLWGFPLAWVVGLWVFNIHALGSPWLYTLYSQAGLPSMRFLVGQLGFFAMEYTVVWANVVLCSWGILSTQRHTRKISWLLLLLLWSTLAWGPQQKASSEDAADLLKDVAVVQGNLSIEAERIWLSNTEKQAYYEALIKKLPADAVIILPEGVLYQAQQQKQLALAHLPGQRIIAGGLQQTSHGTYNGSFLFSPHHPLQYVRKRYLVPFGEVNPVLPESVYRWAADTWNMPYTPSLQPGTLAQPLLQDGPLKIGPLVCFEALYPHLAKQYKQQGATLLVTMSNLGWYHQHPWLEKQFLAINQLRAAETHLPLVFAANTGISALIDSSGRIVQQAPSGQAVVLTIRGSEPLSSLSPHGGQSKVQ